MLLNIFLAVLTVWAAVYSVSYAVALFKGENVTGGFLMITLAFGILGLCLNFLTEIF